MPSYCWIKLAIVELPGGASVNDVSPLIIFLPRPRERCEACEIIVTNRRLRAAKQSNVLSPRPSDSVSPWLRTEAQRLRITASRVVLQRHGANNIFQTHRRTLAHTLKLRNDGELLLTILDPAKCLSNSCHHRIASHALPYLTPQTSMQMIHRRPA